MLLSFKKSNSINEVQILNVANRLITGKMTALSLIGNISSIGLFLGF